MDAPTFSPSVSVSDASGQRCHLFVRNGRIEFVAGCKHRLDAQTVDLPEWPYAKGEFNGIEEPKS